MKVTSLISTLFLGSCALARPLDERTLEERQDQKQLFITTGVPGTVYPRLEVREMKDTKPNQYTLLIVALNRWMKQSQTDYNGYFQFASIHGVPRDRYNNVDSCGTNCANTDGYGVHDNVLFPTWHRVYLATFEQRFLNIVRNVASEYPDAQRPTMIAAANQMRWPFYDSAIRPQNGKPAFPLLMSDVTVTVNGPKGKVTLTNPLFRYDIADPSKFVYAHFTEWKRTFRYPNTNDPNAASQTQSVVNAFANIRQNLADQFYNMFTNCHDYLHFSNDQAGSSIPSCATSVEDIHNAIHNAIGGTGNQDTGLSGGHMTYLPISSYDPAFWLHHSNIDRIFAMWQRINPNSWITDQVAPTASWTIAQGSTVKSSDGLTPFFKNSNRDFWTSNDVKDWTVFGYTYSDFTVTDGSAAAINRRINGLYGPNANIVVAKRDAEPQILDTLENMGSGVTDTVKNVVDGVEGAIGDLINPLTAHNGSTFQYVANIFTPRYALNGSYNIFLFNDVPSSELTSTWITDPKLIGMMGVTSKPNMVDNPLIASGSIPLTRALQDSVNSSFLGGVLSDLTEALVVPYLTQKLQWRVQGPLGENIDPGTIEGFVVSVFASSAAPHNDDELPQYSEFINLLDVTKSQSGGANNSEQVAPPTISIPALPVSLPSYSSY